MFTLFKKLPGPVQRHSRLIIFLRNIKGYYESTSRTLVS